MLPSFHIRNLQSPLEAVRITGPYYDDTLSSEPRATLKYKDDDGDSITIGSSLELEQCLGDRTSLAQRRQLAEVQKSPKSLTEARNRHIFSIDNDEKIQDIWYRIRESSKCESAATAKDFAVAALTPDEKTREVGNVENSPHAAEPNKNVANLGVSIFEDRRALHFNSTNPTKVSAPQEPVNLLDRNLSNVRTGEDNDIPALEKADILAKDQATTQFKALTLEGKRQAQLAGEKFRARGLNYRPRNISTGPADRQNYHNRWAMYNSAEKPEDIRAVLTRDAQRQAQTAGDRLRSKTNRMRHVKAVPNCASIIDQNFGQTSKDQYPLCSTQPKETSNPGSASQMTLLELFESELSRKPEPSASQTERNLYVSQNSPSASLMPSVDPSANSIAFARCNASSQTQSEIIENGIKSAVQGFELCLRGIVDTLKTIQPSKSDKEILAESSDFLQNFANKDFSTSVHKEGTGSKHDVMNRTAEAPKVGTLTDSSPNRVHDLGEQEPAEKREIPEISHQTPYEAADGQSQHNSLSLESKKFDHSADLTGPFHYHQPGPIHLPQHDPWMQTSPDMGEVVPKGVHSLEDQQFFYPVETGKVLAKPPVKQYRDSSRRSHYDRSHSPAAATTRFPTIRQFEKSAFLATSIPPFFPTLIDLDAEEGPRPPPRPAKLADKENKSEKPTDFSDGTCTLSIPPTVTQLGPQAGLETHTDQSPNCLRGPNDGPFAGNLRRLHTFDASKNVDVSSNQLAKGTEACSSAANAKKTQTLPRPYSDFLSRDGRLGWNQVSGQHEKFDVNRNVDAKASSMSLPLVTPRIALPRRPGHTLVTNSGIRRSKTNIETRSERRAGHNPHRSASNISRSQDVKMRKCVDQLIGLGFDMERSRLRVYASVANGDLDEAIDIITEDQKVHDSWES